MSNNPLPHYVALDVLPRTLALFRTASVRPGLQLMGEGLVVWKDPKDGGWKAFADRCQVEGGLLLFLLQR